MSTYDGNSTFGQWLREARKRSHLTQSRLAKALGYERESVNVAEGGRRRPSRGFVEALGTLLHLGPELQAELLHFALAAPLPQPVPAWARELSISLGIDELPNNLPAPLTSLVGRDGELGLLRKRFDDPAVRLLTLVGPPGIGKTRLALQLAAEQLGAFGDGVFLIQLASVGQANLVAATIVRTLGLREAGQPAPLETLRDACREWRLLLLLDGFEHVLAAAPIVAALLKVAPRLKVLATSREALAVYGEHHFVVPPLALPEPDRPLPAAHLSEIAAVKLFVQRSQAVDFTFALTEHNAVAVAAICRRLDGIPLAIELAAAHSGHFSPEVLLERITSRLEWLADGPSDQPERLRTWRGAIDWSYALLDADDQVLFARMSVFIGGCTTEAASAVCAGATDTVSREVARGLDALVDKSLLRQITGPGGERRFEQLDSLREYALERLAASGEHEAMARAHADYYLRLAERAEPELWGPNQRAWLERLEAEHPNLRAALGWASAVREPERDSLGLRLVSGLWWFWLVRGYLSEAMEYFEAALAVGDAAPALRARALVRAGHLAWVINSYDRAAAFGVEGLGLSQAVGDQQGVALGKGVLAYIALARGDFAQAADLAAEALGILQALGDTWGEAIACVGLGICALRTGDLDHAELLLDRALVLHRQRRDTRGTAEALNNLGLVAQARGRPAESVPLHEEALSLLRELGDSWQIAGALVDLGNAEHACAEDQSAAQHHHESLRLFAKLGDRRGIAASLEGLAALAYVRGQPARAVHMLGAADGLRQALGAPVSPVDRTRHEQVLAELREQLPEPQFAAGWQHGRVTPLKQIVADALSESE